MLFLSHERSVVVLKVSISSQNRPHFHSALFQSWTKRSLKLMSGPVKTTTTAGVSLYCWKHIVFIDGFDDTSHPESLMPAQINCIV